MGTERDDREGSEADSRRLRSLGFVEGVRATLVILDTVGSSNDNVVEVTRVVILIYECPDP